MPEMARTSEKDYLYVSVLFLFAFFLSVSCLIFAEPYLYDIFLPKWEYYGIIYVTFLYLTALFIVWNSCNVISNHIAIPSVLFLSFMGYYIYLGTIDHYLQVLTGAVFTYKESITSGYNYISFSLLSWIMGYLLGQRIIGRLSLHKAFGKASLPKHLVIWDKKKLYLVTLFWGSIGIVSFTVFYAFYVKGLPLLQGTAPNVSMELRNLVITKAHNIHTMAVNGMSFALLYSGVYLALYKRNTVIIMVFMSAITAFLFWGARIYIAIPFLMFFPFLSRIRSYSLRKVVGVMVLVVLTGSIYGQIRNRSFVSEHIDFSDRTRTERLADLHMGPEFRDTLGVISHLDELQEEYSASCYFKGIFLTAVPKKILALVGVDKDELFSEEGIGSGWLIARVTRDYDWGGIRSGIMGQTLMAFGAKGVFFVFVAYGILFSLLDRYSKVYNDSSPYTVYIYILSGLFSFSIIGTTHSVFSKFWYFTYAYFLTFFLATKISHLIHKIDKLNQHRELKQ